MMKKKKKKESLKLERKRVREDRLYAPVCGVVFMRADAEPAPYISSRKLYDQAAAAGFLLLL
jgi:hypothetical protein